jgi:hypothetical protein
MRWSKRSSLVDELIKVQVGILLGYYNIYSIRKTAVYAFEVIDE